MTSEIIYDGNLRTSCTHIKSGIKIITDAPIDNRGRGEAFSPTDLVATAMGSCIMTIMGIKALDHNIDMVGAKMSINKTMLSNPRRIGQLDINFQMPEKEYSKIQKQLLEKTLVSCPVGESLLSELIVNINLSWND